jgi:hypothetical protein
VENKGFWALEVPPKRRFTRKHKGPIYKQKTMCYQVRGALDRRLCDRSQSRMHSIV